MKSRNIRLDHVTLMWTTTMNKENEEEQLTGT